MTQGQQSPLAELHDIHTPEVIGWWPLAPGWYLLGLLVLLIIIAVTVVSVRRYKTARPRREALQLLACYQQEYQQQNNSQLSAARTSELLKRVALVYFPRANVASLTGDAWIHFLNTTAKGLDFNSVREALLDAPYQIAQDRDLQPLFIMVRQWISQRRGRCLN